MANTLSSLDTNASLAILREALEVSTTSTMHYGSNGAPVVNTLTVPKKSLMQKIFKK